MKLAKETGTEICSNISHFSNGYSIACPFFHFLLPGPFITQTVRQTLNTLWLEPRGLTNVIYTVVVDLNGKIPKFYAF